MKARIISIIIISIYCIIASVKASAQINIDSTKNIGPTGSISVGDYVTMLSPIFNTGNYVNIIQQINTIPNDSIRFLVIKCFQDSAKNYIKALMHSESGVLERSMNNKASMDSLERISQDKIHWISLNKSMISFIDSFLKSNPNLAKKVEFATFTCPDCIGFGKISHFEDCVYCHGKRQLKCHICNGSKIAPCEKCKATGVVQCITCNGKGKKVCWKCQNIRDWQHMPCSVCGTDGYLQCTSCLGYGTINCESCKGVKSLNCSGCDVFGNETCVYCTGKGEFKAMWNCNRCSGTGKIRDTAGKVFNMDNILCIENLSDRQYYIYMWKGHSDFSGKISEVTESMDFKIISISNNQKECMHNLFNTSYNLYITSYNSLEPGYYFNKNSSFATGYLTTQFISIGKNSKIIK